MNHVTNESKVMHLPLTDTDLNLELALQIMDDCREAGEPSSYRADAAEILKQPELARDEQCLIVALPGIDSTSAQPSTEKPMATVVRESDDEYGTVYLQLRAGQVLVEADTLGLVETTDSRWVVLYLFDDECTLEMIPVTEDLRTDIQSHRDSAGSDMSNGDIFRNRGGNAFQLPAVIRRACKVAAEEEPTAEDELSAISGDDEECIPF